MSAKQTRRKPKRTLLYAGSVIAVVFALVLIVWMLVLRNGVGVERSGADAENDLPINTRDPSEFTDDDGLYHYPGAKLGIDAAEFQGEIDWPAVRAAGVEFAIIRAGFRGYSKGTLAEDACFRQNLREAKAAGLSVGVYFFSQAISEAEAVEEAEFVLSLLGEQTLELPIFFDWEETFDSGSRTATAASVAVSAYADAFCSRITQAGYSAGVYFNQKYGYGIMRLETLSDYSFWLAEYRSAPTFFYDVQFWQYTGEGHVDGIQTTVDLNLYFPDN